jgi:hypothetical protein
VHCNDAHPDDSACPRIYPSPADAWIKVLTVKIPFFITLFILHCILDCLPFESIGYLENVEMSLYWMQKLMLDRSLQPSPRGGLKAERVMKAASTLQSSLV